MASGPFTSGLVVYKQSYSFLFDKAYSLKINKLKERLDKNLNWIGWQQIEMRRLNSKEIIFTLSENHFLQKGKAEIIYGHLFLDPNADKFTITGRLSKTVFFLIPLFGYAISTTTDSTLESIAYFIGVTAFAMFGIKKLVSNYYRKRYLEFANAVFDVLEAPNKEFKYAPIRSRDLTDREAP